MRTLTLQDLQRLPKTDLHVHLDGSLRLATILELAEAQKVKLPGDSLESLAPFVQVGEDCKSLVDYLRAFDAIQKRVAARAAVTKMCERDVANSASALKRAAVRR